jgi:hypothetical protein
MSIDRLLGNGYLVLVFLFLYVPTACVVFYSFNESQLVTVWSGFSFKWYGELTKDGELMSAAWASLQIGLATAFASVFVGTWAGFVLYRFRAIPWAHPVHGHDQRATGHSRGDPGNFLANDVCRPAGCARLAAARHVHDLDRAHDVVRVLRGHYRVVALGQPGRLAARSRGELGCHAAARFHSISRCR